MAVMDPASIPNTRDHLEPDDRDRLMRFELLVEQGRHDDAQETAEELWLEGNDAHRRLFQGISNAMTAVCAREAGQLRGAREIARQTRSMLEAYPRHALGMDIEVLLRSVDEFVRRGEGPILLRAQGRDLG
jgi:hypothetical protein